MTALWLRASVLGLSKNSSEMEVSGSVMLWVNWVFEIRTWQLLRSLPSFFPWRPSQKHRKLPGVFTHSSAQTPSKHSSTSEGKGRESARRTDEQTGSRGFEFIEVLQAVTQAQITKHGKKLIQQHQLSFEISAERPKHLFDVPISLPPIPFKGHADRVQ